MVDQNAESTDANFRFDGFVSGEMRAESSPRLLHPMKEHFGLAIDKSRFQVLSDKRAQASVFI